MSLNRREFIGSAALASPLVLVGENKLITDESQEQLPGDDKGYWILYNPDHLPEVVMENKKIKNCLELWDLAEASEIKRDNSWWSREINVWMPPSHVFQNYCPSPYHEPEVYGGECKLRIYRHQNSQFAGIIFIKTPNSICLGTIITQHHSVEIFPPPIKE